jgi:hypothetical protein
MIGTNLLVTEAINFIPLKIIIRVRKDIIKPIIIGSIGFTSNIDLVIVFD